MESGRRYEGRRREGRGLKSGRWWDVERGRKRGGLKSVCMRDGEG